MTDQDRDGLGPLPERAGFAAWCVANGHGTMDDVMTPLLDRSLLVLLFSAWQGGLAAERERLRREVSALHMTQAVNNQNHPSAWHDGVDAALDVMRVLV